MPAEQVAIWLWNHITEEWEKAPAVVTTVRLVGAGPFVAGAHKLCWLACNPAAGNSVFELSDDTTGLTATVLDCFSTSREGKGWTFKPPMNFVTGIYLKTFTNMTSVTIGYI